VAGDAEGGEPVQDRPVETGRLREGGLRVQRIVVSAQAVDQRSFRPRAEIADGIRSALGNRMRRRRRARRAAETAVAAAEDRLRDRGDGFAGRFIRDLPFGQKERALAGALVDDFDDARMSD
jgi:hypothetical protein